MPEFRKIIETPPVNLRRKDIEGLARILTENLPVQPRAFEFSFSCGDKAFRADSLEELLQQDLPSTVDSLTFTVRGWSDEGAIDRGIWFNLRQTVGDYQIHAHDEVWFKGKIQQINEFLRARRSWYATFRSSFAGLVGAFQSIAFLALLFFIYKTSIAFAVLSGLTIALLSLAFRAFQNGRLFPKAKIVLRDPTNKLDKDVLLLIFTALSALATVVGVVVQVYLAK